MVGRLELLGLRIVSVLLVLLGITLFLSPRIAYTTHEKIRSTQYKVQRDQVILVRRPVAVAVAAGGVLIWILVARKTR
jgi:hypothetical protein